MFDFCDGSDPLLEEMRRRGVNILVPPVELIAAGDLVLAEKRGLGRRADWGIVLGNDPVRAVAHSAGFDAATFQRSGKVKIGAAAELGGRVLQTLGVEEGKLGTQLARLGVEAVEIELIAPAFDTLTNLDAVLAALDAAGAKPAPAYEGRRLLLVSKVWRAKGMTMKLHSSKTIAAEALASVADEFAGTTSVSVKSDRLTKLEFRATAEPLVFGVGLRELALKDGYWVDATPKKHQNIRGEEDASANKDNERFAFFSDDMIFVELAGD